MDVDYDRIATGYDAYRRSAGPYMPPIIELARRCAARNILELGAGTGNCAAALLAAHAARVTAVDRSAGMLRQARKKRLHLRMVQADAVALPFGNSNFDFLLAVYLIHHVPSLDGLMSESYRVLHQGFAVFVTASHSFIVHHPMNKYFPSFAAVDLARFPHEDTVAKAMRHAGFLDVASAVVRGQPRPVDAAYADQVAAKFISTYELIPPGEFAEGLSRLRRDVEKDRVLDFTITLESVIIHGRR